MVLLDELGKVGLKLLLIHRSSIRLYVPNAYACNEDHLIVWSVIMAEQLANLEGDLDGTKTQGLTLIYNKFKRNI